jgi:hypothetical protein
MIEVQVEQLTAEEQRCLEAASITVTAFTASVNAPAANLDPEQFEELCERYLTPLSHRTSVSRWNVGGKNS